MDGLQSLNDLLSGSSWKFVDPCSRLKVSRGGMASVVFLIRTQTWPGAHTEQALNRDMEIKVSWISSNFYLVKIVST